MPELFDETPPPKSIQDGVDVDELDEDPEYLRCDESADDQALIDDAWAHAEWTGFGPPQTTSSSS